MSDHVTASPQTMALPPARHSRVSLDDTQSQFASNASRNPYHGRSQAFDDRVNEVLQHWRIPGVAIAVIDRHTITSHGYGVAHVGENAPDVTPDTVFEIASMSKSFTAAAMALLVQNDTDNGMKSIKWQTPVATLDPEFRFADEIRTQEVSVEDILSHRTGLVGHDESLRGANHKNADTLSSVIRNMRNLSSAYPLRTTYEYNNLLYSCAAGLVETLTCTAFPTFLRQNFWDQLNMQHTWLGPDNVPPSEAPNVAIGSIYSSEKKQHISLPHTPEPEGFGAGSIQSTVTDIARWVHAHMYRLSPLTEDSYTALSTPRILAETPPEGQRGCSPTFYCLGWHVTYYRGETIIQHDGSWAGFNSSMLYLPAREWGFVILGNSEDAYPGEVEITWHLIDELLCVDASERFDWRAYYDAKVEKWMHVKTKEELFPEAEEHVGDEPQDEPDLRHFSGRYESKGYHDIELVYNEGKEQLEVDGSDRSYSFIWNVKERAYGYWYVCEDCDPGSGEKSTRKCQFDVEQDSGRVRRFGVDLYEEIGDLIWFERVE